jgi:hypothetical protein
VVTTRNGRNRGMASMSDLIKDLTVRRVQEH